MKVELARGRDSDRHLLLGWAGLEDDLAWAIGARSVLTLPTPAQADDYSLELRLFPFTTPRLPAQRLVVRVNGTDIASLLVRREMTLDLLIPWSAMAGSEELSIELDHPDAARPIDHGLSGDTRHLALAVRSVWLRGMAAERAISQAAAALPAAGSELASALDRGADRALATSFESLGINCEFGNVQSECGAEPLGLLRWSFSPLPSLLAALEARFAGIGARDNLQIGLRGEEYYVTDQRYGISYHTWRQQHELTAEALGAQESRRITYLARKLVEDLSAGEKIFVFHDAGRSGLAEIRPLLAALRSYGPNTLLWVTAAEAPEQVGRVVLAEPGLLQGFIDRFAPLQQAVRDETALGSWMAIVRAADSLARRRHGAAA